MKRCGLCNQDRDVAAFSFKSRAPDKLHPWCKECKNARQRKHYAANSEAILARQKSGDIRRVRRAVDLKRFYGITPDEYDALAAGQGGRCAICGQEPKRLVVDHCHQSSRVRGLLCDHCNTAIGLMNDDPERLENAIDYLRSGGRVR